MTVTLNLKPEFEAGLLAQARASGMTVEEYAVESILTFNAADFKRYNNITAVHPDSIP